MPPSIAGFDLKEPLPGESIVGSVYRATRAGRVVALRLFGPEVTGDRTLRSRLATLLHASLELRHPNLPTLIDHGTDGEYCWAAYGFVDGEALDDSSALNPLSEPELLAVGLALCSALATAHAQGVFHGAITPNNVRFDERGAPQLLDLGCARPEVDADAASDLRDLGGMLRRSAGKLSLSDAAQTILNGLSSAGSRYASAAAAGGDIARALQGLKPLGPREASAEEQVVGRVRLPGLLGLQIAAEAAPAKTTSAPAAAPSAPARSAPQPGKINKEERNFYGDGFLLKHHTEAFLKIPVYMWSEKLQDLVEQGEEVPPGYEAEKAAEDDPAALSQRMIPSEDMTRAYNLEGELGRGGQGVVYRVRVQGDQSFDGFSEPVEEAALKVSRDKEALLREKAIYSQPNPSIVKLLDAGELSKRKNYLLLETLYPHPYNLFGGTERERARVDLATAINTYLNLLASLHELYFRKQMPLVLCDLKPDNIMIRLPRSEAASLTMHGYLDRLATNAWEPVLMDMGCAQHAGELRKARGRVDTIYGTPQFMPPETFPRSENGRSIPGIVGDRMDVYALTLTFYLHLTGDRPYSGHDLSELPVKERIREIRRLKLEGVDPIDHELLRKATGKDVQVYEEILAWGLHPNPSHRATAKGMLDLVWQRFDVEELNPRPSPYHYDQAQGLRFVQQIYPTVSSIDNLYLSPSTHEDPPAKLRPLGPGRKANTQRAKRPPSGRFPTGRSTGRYQRPSASGRIPQARPERD